MQHRALIAFAAAPFLAILAGMIASTPFLAAGYVDLGGLFLGAMVGIVIAYLVALALGVPCFLVLRRLRIWSRWAYAALGVGFGILGWMVAHSPTTGVYWRLAHEATFALISGLVGGLMFWYIAVGSATDGPQ